MNTIGLIGGSTWHSTVDYYKLINEKVSERLGGYASARIIINSVNFQKLMDFNKTNDWEGIENYINGLANDLVKARADCILLGANTLHRIAEEIQQKITIPLIHIGKETAKVINANKIHKVALLGTRVTMQSDFYTKMLNDFGIEVILPLEKDMDFINTSIYEEFGKGVFSNDTKLKYLKILEKLKLKGIEGVVLGCTEIPMLIKPEDTDLVLFNTTEIHVNAAVDFSLA